MNALREHISVFKFVKTRLDHTAATVPVVSSLMSMGQAVMVSIFLIKLFTFFSILYGKIVYVCTIRYQ